MSDVVFSGKSWSFGDHVDTDMIIPSRFLVTDNEIELGKHVFSEMRPEFVSNVKAGDILVGGKNFGCGSAREHAPLAIRGAGISCIIAESFARIFFRNCINRGYYAIELPDATRKISQGDQISINIQKGTIVNHTTGESYSFIAFPDHVKEICDSGGLFQYIQDRLNKEALQQQE